VGFTLGDTCEGILKTNINSSFVISCGSTAAIASNFHWNEEVHSKLPFVLLMSCNSTKKEIFLYAWFIKLWWLAFTTIAFTRKCQRGIKTVTIAMSAFLHCTSSLFFLKQWENDINQTCNILSTSCRCKRTIIERSVKAKILILRRLGSRQFLLANMTPFRTPFAYLGSWIKSKKFASERGAGTYFIFSALDKKCRFPTTCRKCLFFLRRVLLIACFL